MEIDLLLLPFVAQASRTDLQQFLYGERFFQAGENPASCRSAVLQPPEAVAAMTGMVREFSHIGCAKQFQHVEPVHLRHFQIGNQQVIVLTADAFHQVTYAPACRAHHPMVREHLLDGGQQDGIVVQCHNGKKAVREVGCRFLSLPCPPQLTRAGAP